MSHNIEYFTYPEKVNRSKVQEELDHYVAMEDWQEGCQGLYHGIRWLDGTVYSDRDEAEKVIERLDKGNYDCLAVKYNSCAPFTDAKLKELEQKRVDAYKEYEKRNDTIYACTVTSAFIGCKFCGSRLSRKHMADRRLNCCPVCRKDLRPEYMQKSIQTAEAKWRKAQETAKAYRIKKSPKKVCWLVKIEYHT